MVFVVSYQDPEVASSSNIKIRSSLWYGGYLVGGGAEVSAAGLGGGMNSNKKEDQKQLSDVALSPARIFGCKSALAPVNASDWSPKEEQQEELQLAADLLLLAEEQRVVETTPSRSAVGRPPLHNISYPPDKPLSLSFSPGPNDVICARGRKSFEHIGNRRFRVTIECNTAQYSRVSTPPEKAYIVLSIMNTIRGKSPDGGFVKKRGDGEEGWVEVGDIVARKKVTYALRLAVTRYRESEEGVAAEPRNILDSIVGADLAKTRLGRPSKSGRESIARQSIRSLSSEESATEIGLMAKWVRKQWGSSDTTGGARGSEERENDELVGSGSDLALGKAHNDI